MSSRLQPIKVLLIEDNHLDARSVISAAKRANLAVEIQHIDDGRRALDQLEQNRPDLVLLDLNLPGLDGHDILAEIRSKEKLRSLPVVILTSSEEDRDIARSYDLGANAYVTKPVALEAWKEVVSQIDGFWFTVAKLPPPSE